jgi:2-keto-3-deoxy-L-rhamnonate aldolase RhmA
VIVPQVNSVDQATRIVAAAKYAPDGQRGRGLARAHKFGATLAEYSASANEEVAVVVQAEHHEAVTHIRDIVRVKGVDAVLVGPYDLASSLGRPGEVDHPDVRRAITAVRDACREAGLPTGILGVSADALAPHLAQGFTLIISGIDALLLGQSMQGLLAQVRQLPRAH